MLTISANVTSWFQVRATGSPPLEFDFYSPPAFGNITLPDPIDLNMSYTPDNGYCNLEGVPEYVQYSVADVYGQAGEATITVDVVCPASPQAQDVDARIFVGQASVEVRPIVTPPEPYPTYYTLTVTSQPKMGTVVFDKDRVMFTYTPFNGSCVRNKVDQFQYRVFDPYTQGPSFGNVLIDCMPVLRRRALLEAAREQVLGVLNEQPQSRQRGTATIPPVLVDVKPELMPLGGRKAWGIVSKGGWVAGVAAPGPFRHDRSKQDKTDGQQRLSGLGWGGRQQWWPPGAAANTAAVVVPGRYGNPRWALWADGRGPRAMQPLEQSLPEASLLSSRVGGGRFSGIMELIEEPEEEDVMMGSLGAAAARAGKREASSSQGGGGDRDLHDVAGFGTDEVFAARAAKGAAAAAAVGAVEESGDYHKKDTRVSMAGSSAVDSLPPGSYEGGSWPVREV
jgi:hypothetical protein